MNDESRSRNLVKLVRDLQRRKARERRARVVLEGRRLVADVLEAGARVLGLVVAEDAAAADAVPLLEEAERRHLDVQRLPRAEFDALAGTESPGGVLAVADWAPRDLASLAPPASCLLLVLDGVQDPGNVGTMIRTAHALGACATVALDGTADVRSPKVLRSAMGSHFRHPVAEAAFDAFAAWAARGGFTVLCAASDGAPVADVHRGGRVALVVGSEGHGVRAAWAAHPHRRVAIPMRGDAESLNAAVAAAILAWELLRDVR
jgi:TrmH family RNA methyltransferase